MIFRESIFNVLAVVSRRKAGRNAVKRLPGISLVLVVVMFIAGISTALAQESRLTEKQKSKLIIRFPKSDVNKDGKLDEAELLALREFFQNRKMRKDLTPRLLSYEGCRTAGFYS